MPASGVWHKPLEAEQVEKVCDLARHGMPYTIIAKTCHMNHLRVKRLLIANKIPLPQRPGQTKHANIIAQRKECIAGLWESKYTLEDIAREAQVSIRQVRTHLRTLGYELPHQKPGPKARGEPVKEPICNHCGILLSRAPRAWGNVCKWCVMDMLGIKRIESGQRREEYDLGEVSRRGKVLG